MCLISNIQLGKNKENASQLEIATQHFEIYHAPATIKSSTVQMSLQRCCKVKMTSDTLKKNTTTCSKLNKVRSWCYKYLPFLFFLINFDRCTCSGPLCNMWLSLGCLRLYAGVYTDAVSITGRCVGAAGRITASQLQGSWLETQTFCVRLHRFLRGSWVSSLQKNHPRR